jgi:hypothetical protein
VSQNKSLSHLCQIFCHSCEEMTNTIINTERMPLERFSFSFFMSFLLCVCVCMCVCVCVCVCMCVCYWVFKLRTLHLLGSYSTT